MPTLISFLCFMGSVLLLVSIWFSNMVRSTLEDTLYQNATASASKAANQLNLSIKDYSSTAVHLAFIDPISPRLFQNNPYDAYMRVKEFDFTTIKFSDLVVCYDETDFLLGVRGNCYPEVSFPEVSELEGLIKTIRAVRSPTLLSTQQYGAEWEYSRLLFVYPLSTRHAAVFVLNHNMLGTLLSQTDQYSGQKLLALVNSENQLLWSNKAMEPALLETILLHESHPSGNYLALDNTKYIFSSNLVYQGMRLIVLNEVTSQFDSMHTLITMLVMVCIAILFLGIVMMIFTVRRSYMPIARLVRNIKSTLPHREGRDIDMLQEAYSHYNELLQKNQQNEAFFSPDQLHSLFVLRTIGGRSLDEHELNTLCESLHLEFRHPYYFACILLFDNPPDESLRQYMEDRFNYQNSGEAAYCFYLQPGGHSAVGIINIALDASLRQYEFGNHLLSSLPAELGATLGMGRIYESIAEVGKSYLEAHAAIDYRLIKGCHTAIVYDEIHLPDTVSVYPRQLLSAFVQVLRSWDVDSIHSRLKSLADYIQENNLPLQQVKCICFDLTSAFLQEISSLETHVTYKLSANYDVFNIAEYNSISELVQNICDFSQVVQQYITKRDEHEAGKVVQQCIDYMTDNISNVQFSLSSCAEKFDVAPQTLRRKFKDATGSTLSAYMTKLRLDRARELLTTTNLDVNTICLQCGYIDQSSFTRLFRAENGVSPGKYREMHTTIE